MPLNLSQFQQTHAQIVAKAWADEQFKQRFVSDPAAVLHEHGVALPPGMMVRTFEMQPNTIYLSIPPRPEVSDTNLTSAGAGGQARGSTMAPVGDAVIMGTYSIGDPSI